MLPSPLHEDSDTQVFPPLVLTKTPCPTATQ